MTDIYALLGIVTDKYDEELYNNVQEKIGIGELYTYKALCETLDQKRVSGNSKIRHLKELGRYFDFEYDKEIKRYIIKEIYTTPLPPLSTAPANTLYAKHIKVILLSYLLKCKDINPGGAVYISSQRLYEVLGMVNDQYINMQRKDQKPLLRESLKKEFENIYELEDKTINFYIKNFYDRCRSKFSSIINTALDTLEKQNYITYSKAYHIYKRDLNEENEVIRTYYGGYSTDEETADLLDVEREIMDEFGFKDDQDIWFGGRTEEYWKRVVEIAQELYPEIHNLYRCHKIIGTKTNILKALSKEQESKEMHELNQKILNYIDTQAENNMYRSIEKNPDDHSKQLSNKYVEAQKYLSGKLIKIRETQQE